MYDIRHEVRLRRVHQVVKAFGDRLQYSVDVCDLSPAELIRMRWELNDAMNLLEDAVAILDLGDLDRRGPAFEFLGVRPRLPTTDATVI